MDIEAKIWNYSNTGTRVHAFSGGAALCRSSIRRHGVLTSSLDYCEAKDHPVCAACDKKFNAAIERQEASMQPSTGEGDYLPPAETSPTKTHHYNALGGQRFIEGRGWVNHCRVCQVPEGAGDHFYNKETNDMGYDKRRGTGPLSERQEQILVMLADGKRQKEVSKLMGFSEAYVSGEVCLAALKLGVRTTAAAVARYRSYQTYLKVADMLLGGRVKDPIDAAEEHVNHVLEGMAEEVRIAARKLLPQ